MADFWFNERAAKGIQDAGIETKCRTKAACEQARNNVREIFDKTYAPFNANQWWHNGKWDQYLPSSPEALGLISPRIPSVQGVHYGHQTTPTPVWP
jgi:hypothetical protein